MQLKFVDLVTEIPDDWIDDSSLTFSIPSPDDLSAPLANRPAGGPCGNVTIKWDRDAGTASARAYLDARLAELASSLERFTVDQRHEVDVGDGAMAIAECSLELEAPIKQLFAARRVGTLMVVITGTTFAGVFARWRDTFIEIAKKTAPQS